MSKDPNARHLFSERVRIGRNVRSPRDWRDKRQEPLAEFAGFSDRTLRRIESGDTSVGVNKFILAAKALDVPLHWLFTEDWPQWIEEYEAGKE
ncbi:helix-turn-helix domain-containing protein [Streptacidiphilus sp. PAMC 29251]